MIRLESLYEDAAQSGGPRRRIEDGSVTLLVTDPRPATSPVGGAGSVSVLASERFAAEGATPERLARSVFLLDLGGAEVVLLPAAEALLLPRGSGGEELQRQASAAALAWRQARYRLERRLRLPDWLIAYADELIAAREPRGVHEAVVVHLPLIVGAAHAVVYVHEDGPGGERFRPTVGARDLEPLGAEAAMGFTSPVLLTAAELGAGAGLAPLAALAGRFGGAHLLCAPLGADALLVLVERRRGRVFTAEDRDLLRGALRQAEAALARFRPAGGRGASGR